MSNFNSDVKTLIIFHKRLRAGALMSVFIVQYPVGQGIVLAVNGEP
ncbi:MAG: hypothetical protein AAFZ15_21900 [Bacteroidota bacterium]